MKDLAGRTLPLGTLEPLLKRRNGNGQRGKSSTNSRMHLRNPTITAALHGFLMDL